MDTLFQDLRYALRTLLYAPGFTAVTVMTLALGIGATTAIFSLVDTVLLRPLPYRDADRIVTLWQRNLVTGDAKVEVSPANFMDWRDRSRSFSRMAAIEPYGLDLTGLGEPVGLRTALVTEGYFEILGVGALLGRTLEPRDYAPGSERTVVIGYGLWQQRFGSDRGIIGRKLTLDGDPTTVVGVMPPEFRFPEEYREVWAPLVYDENDRQRRGATYLQVVARLRPGVTPAQARGEMSGIAERLAGEYPRTNAEMRTSVVPLAEHLVGEVRPALLVLLGAVGFVLLIACANVASLFLARAAGRRREFAIRAAVGAARRRLVRQMVTESLLVALLGGAGGVLLAYWGIDLITGIIPEGLPRVDELRIDGRILLFALAASVLAAVLFGLTPSLQASRPDLQRFLADGGRGAPGSTRPRLRNALVVAETALALVLLIGAGLLVRSFVELLRVDLGFAPEGRAVMQLFVYDRPPPQQVRFFEEAMERIGALPGVQAVGAVSAFPLAEADVSRDVSFVLADRPEPPPGQEPSAYVSTSTPGYFEALGIGVRRGRLLAPGDRADAPLVAVVNETMARRHWPDEDPVGKRIQLRFEQGEREVVGVAADVRLAGLDAEPRPEVFIPLTQRPSGSMTLVARTVGDPAALIPAMKAQVWEMNPQQTIYSTATVEQLLDDSLREERFRLLLLGSFSAIALLLAAIGIYGLVSYTTRARTHEFGVRLALGADAAGLVRGVVGQGVRLALAGAVAGLLGAAALTRFLRGFLFGVGPTDPVTYVALAALVVLAAAAATWLPARRAAGVDPMITLRSE
ncbi:MAG TPA: ABC transporter permease [Longimicrobiaceae bacterium]|nr:ABC transporter permease [Longimicrobiaceae bacterium]